MDGALAQLIERSIRIAEVAGLIPARSTKSKKEATCGLFFYSYSKMGKFKFLRRTQSETCVSQCFFDEQTQRMKTKHLCLVF